VTIGSIAEDPDGRRFLYYLGWNLGKTVPWRNFVGLAVAEKGSNQFTKHTSVPIMDRSKEDPLSLTYPWVLRHGGTWRMWYGSTQMWSYGEYDQLHLIKYAESGDGISWNRTDNWDLISRGAEDYGMSRPSVLIENEVHRMWFSYRGKSYRIGYAESLDGRSWQRLDKLCNLEPSGSGWDATSVEYPCVIKHDDQLFMFYNGDRFGATGFGIALLE
jgi:hypothetical protein